MFVTQESDIPYARETVKKAVQAYTKKQFDTIQAEMEQLKAHSLSTPVKIKGY